jgi:hypothetical protein
MSREHYISENVLKTLSQVAPLRPVGLPWLKGESKPIPNNALAAKCLCARHNSALSGLDTIGGRLLDSFDVMFHPLFRHRRPSDPKQRVFLFNEHDVERWFLKVLCGVVFSGNAARGGVPIKGWKPTLQWLRILFGYESFPLPWGIYMENAIPGHKPSRYFGFSFAPLSDGTRIQGCSIGFHNRTFILAMENPPVRSEGTIFNDATYRPRSFWSKQADCVDAIFFHWRNHRGYDVEFRD